MLIDHVILIKGSGYKSGKDTAARFIAQQLQESGYMVFKEMFAGFVKDTVYRMTGEPLRIVEEDRGVYHRIVRDFTQEQKEKFIPEYHMTLGKILQLLATEGMREGFDKDIHIKTMARRAMEDIDASYRFCRTHLKKEVKGTVLILPDWRFDNENDNLHKYLNYNHIHTINVHRESNDISKDGRDPNHGSESGITEDAWNNEISNNGTLEDLKITCQVFVDSIIG